MHTDLDCLHMIMVLGSFNSDGIQTGVEGNTWDLACLGSQLGSCGSNPSFGCLQC